jgi:alpha-1,3-rhamnosyl/mannosyltransferase
MVQPRPRVILDATALLGETVLHGIGRYIADLLHGLAATRDDWQDSLDVEALVDLPLVRQGRLTADLAAAAEEAVHGPRKPDWHNAARRWIALGPSVRGRAAAIHVPHPGGFPLLLPMRSIITCHDLIPLEYPAEYIGSPALHALKYALNWHRYRMPTRVVAISEKTRQALSLLRVPPERIDVVPNGIHMEQWYPSPSELRLRAGGRLSPAPEPRASMVAAVTAPRSRPYVLYVGYCDYRKNIHKMLETLAIVRRSLDVDLLWAGKLPQARIEGIRREARELGVLESVNFLGFVPDRELADLYRGAIALLFLSRLEGFGLPVAEAMASGCPVIVANGSGSDAVAGSAGIVVDPDDAVAAAAAVELLSRPENRHRYARLGRERVVRFDRRNMARGTIESYHRALGRAG